MKPAGYFTLSLASTLLFCAPLQAADVPVAAQRHFTAGVSLSEQGECEATPPRDETLCRRAIDEFRTAYRLFPSGLGALRNRAFVERGLGLLATASASFEELAQRASEDSDPARRAWAMHAQAEVRRLAPYVPRIVLSATRDVRSLELDGRPTATGELLVDPGQHTLTGRARDGSSLTRSLRVLPGDRLVVRLTSPSRPPAPRVPERSTAPASSWPLALFIGGGALVAGGLASGYRALRIRSEACGPDRLCEPEQLQTGLNYAHASTALVSVGLSGVVLGLVLHALQPEPPSAKLAPARK